MTDKKSKEELLAHLENMEKIWTQQKEKLINEKRVLQRTLRSLKKELEVQKNNLELEKQSKEEELKILKDLIGGKIKKWDDGYQQLVDEKKILIEKVAKLESNMDLTRNDSLKRLDLAGKEKELLLQEKKRELDLAVKREREKYEKKLHEEVRKKTAEIESALRVEMDVLIEKQREIWEKELKQKEKEILSSRQQWQKEFERQRVDYEQREKEYLQDLLEKFKN